MFKPTKCLDLNTCDLRCSIGMLCIRIMFNFANISFKKCVSSSQTTWLRSIIWAFSSFAFVSSVLAQHDWRSCVPLRAHDGSVSASGLMNWEVTRLTYLYNHINYVHLCRRPSGPPRPDLWTAAGPVRQPRRPVVAIETSVCVCGCAGPRHALQTLASLVPGEQTRHDPGESLFSFREERTERWTGAPLSALRWNAPQCEVRGRSGVVSVKQPAVEMSLFCAECIFFWRHKGLEAFKWSICVPLVWRLRGEPTDRGQTW